MPHSLRRSRYTPLYSAGNGTSLPPSSAVLAASRRRALSRAVASPDTTQTCQAWELHHDPVRCATCSARSMTWRGTGSGRKPRQLCRRLKIRDRVSNSPSFRAASCMGNPTMVTIPRAAPFPPAGRDIAVRGSGRGYGGRTLYPCSRKRCAAVRAGNGATQLRANTVAEVDARGDPAEQRETLSSPRGIRRFLRPGRRCRSFEPALAWHHLRLRRIGFVVR